LYYLANYLSTYDFFYLPKSSFITFDLMKVNWKKVVPLAGAFVAYRIWKLYELGNAVQYNVASVDFIRPVYVQDSLNQFAIRVKFRVSNPTNTSVFMRGITGEMFYANAKVGTFKSGAFEVKSGMTFVDFDFLLENKAVIASLVDAVVSRKYPVIVVKMKKYLTMFSTSETFEINLRDFVNVDKFNIFK